MHHPTAIDLDQLAGDERRGVAGEEGHQIADVIRGSPPLDALGGQDLPVVVLQVRMNLLGIGRECSRRESVDGDAVRPDLPRQRPREADNASLRGDIIEQERDTAEEGDRGEP
jgi:hypothetical protein